MSNKVAILTSGGDSPGMNNAIVAIVNTALSSGFEPYLVYEGFKGLVENNIHEASSLNVNKFISQGGTFIYSARLPEFKEEVVRQKAVANLKKLGIENLIVIGGDGSYMGAARLTEMGIKTIGLPGTIDNDISSSDYTIGFFTSLQTIVQALEQIRDTSESHNRATIVEVMGRYCGDLAIYAAIATGAEILSVPEHLLTEAEIIKQALAQRNLKKRAIIILVTEHQYDINSLALKLEKETNIETKANSLGHIQRGGIPVAYDRINASKMGNYAIKLLSEKKTGLAVGIINGELIATDILKAVEMKRPSRENLIKLYQQIK